jgi:hypothetical protein
VTDKARDGIVQTEANSAKRPWIAPEVEVAPTRGANGSFSRGGSADYGIYS